MVRIAMIKTNKKLLSGSFVLFFSILNLTRWIMELIIVIKANSIQRFLHITGSLSRKSNMLSSILIIKN